MTNERLPLSHFRKMLPDALARLAEVTLATCKAIFTPEPFEPADTWAESTIELPPEVSEQGGYIRLLGYQRELVLAPFEPGVRVVTVMKSARVGFTLLMAILLLYVAAKRKFDAFLAQPIAADAHEFYDDFLQPIMAHSRALSPLRRVPVRNGIQDRWYKFRLITGAAIRLVGAKKADVFRRFKAFIGILDEVDADAYANGGAGDQGNKVELAERRLDSYPGSALVLGGTPTELKTSRLVKYWDMSEQRRYFWPCKHCIEDGHPDDGMQFLVWGSKTSPSGFRWKTNPETGEILDVWYQCLHCQGRIEEDDKAVMDKAGQWRVTRPGKRSGYRAYHIWEAYGFNPKSTWTVIVERFLQAHRDGDLQPFINLSLGEPFEDRGGKKVEVNDFASHCIPYEAEIPNEAVNVTQSVDSQEGQGKENSDGSLIAPARHEASVWGWGVGNKPFLIAHRVIEGVPFAGDTAKRLDDILLRTWTRADGTAIPSAVTFVDGGYDQDAAIAYVKERVGLGWEMHVVRGSKTNDPRGAVIMNRLGESKRTGEKFTWLNVRPAKDHLDRLLRVQTPGPRFVTFPLSMVDNVGYFQGLLTESLRPEKKNGALRWMKDGSDTGEPWDCFVYAYAAQLKAMSLFPAIERIINGQVQSPFSVTTADADGVVQTYSGPDRSAMADKSEERGLVAPPKAQPPKVRNRAQRGDAVPVVPGQPEVALQQGRRRRVGRSSMF